MAWYMAEQDSGKVFIFIHMPGEKPLVEVEETLRTLDLREYTIKKINGKTQSST